MFKISIVIITKNNPESLRNTIESILISKHNEIIVVSGNEHTITGEVQIYCRHPNLTVLEGPDSGIYNAMNKGTQAAQGELVWYLNAGDISLLEKKSDFKKITKKIENKKWLIAMQKPKSKFPKTSLFFSKFLLFSGIKPIPHQSAIFDRQTLLSVGGYNEQYTIEADQEMFLKLYSLNFQPSLWIKNISFHQPGGIGDAQIRGTFQNQIANIKKNLNLSDNENRMLAQILHKMQKFLWTNQ